MPRARARSPRPQDAPGPCHGRAEALRYAVVAVLSARGIALRDEHRARLAAADAAQVDAWLVAAATATTADDALR